MRLALVTIVLLAACSRVAGGIGAAWAVHDGLKVDRADVANPHRLKNACWDGSHVRLFSGRNEVVAFQVIVESDDTGIEALSAALPELVGPGGRRIVYAPPRPDPTDYVGRPIQLFAAHYIRVAEPTSATWIFDRRSPAAPPNPTGEKPTALVPENAAAGKGGMPLSVPPRSSQALWFEIYVADDLPPGVYRGQIQIRADDVRRLPVELRVFDFTLPHANSMNVMLFFESNQVKLYQGEAMDDRYHRFAHRHRVELVHEYDVATATRAAGRFNGADFTPAARYEGPGVGIGNRLAPRTFYGPEELFDTSASAARVADEWMSFLRRSIPGAITFVYMPDEPAPETFGQILQLAGNIKNHAGIGNRLPVLVTHAVNERLAPAIDYWCVPTESYDIAQAAEQAKLGRQVWIYNGHRPHAGSIDYSAPATDPRATLWGCFKHGIPVYFYWHANHWQHNFQKRGERRQNVWAKSITFDSRAGKAGAFANGDGVLLYPGTERLHPVENRGIAGPCGSYALANLRRGMQDHLYLTMARNVGHEAVVRRAIDTVAARMFSEAGAEVGFAQSGDLFEEARLSLAEALAAKPR